MFTDFEYADKRLSDFGWIVGHIDSNSGVAEIDIGCDITFNTVKNNHSSIHYVSSTSYDNVCTPPSFDIFKNPCGKNQEDMYATNDEVSALTKWLNRHEYRKFKPVYDSDDSDIHYYGSFNVKKKTINDRIVGLVLTFNSNAPYGFGEQITNEVDMDNNEVTVSSEFIHIEDCAESKIVNFSTQGNTKQNTTEGNQLWSYGDVTFAGQQGYLIDLDAGDYTFSAEITSTDTDADTCLIYLTDSIARGELQRGQRSSVSFTITESCKSIALYASNDSSHSKGDTATFNNIMLNKGLIELPLEEYTGGQASPNMTYNQEITHAGTYNEETGRYEVKQTFCKKNLWDKEYASDVNNWYINMHDSSNKGYKEMAIFVGKGNEVTFSYLQTLEKGLNLYCGVATDTTESIKYEGWLYHSVGSSYINKSVTITAIEDYVYLRFYGSIDVFMQYIGNDLQIEYGTAATDHEDHESQTVTITSERPITKWDTLMEQDGVIGWGYQGLQMVVDGTETWYSYAVHKGFLLNCEQYGLPSSLNVEGFCNQLLVARASADNVPTIWIGQGNAYIYCINNPFFNNSLEDYGLANFKAHLNENPLEIWTYTDDIEFVPLLEEEQEAIRNLMMYYGVTNVWNDQGMQMQVTYLQDYDNTFTICGESDEYTTLYPNISITCKRDGDLRIKNTLTGNIFEVLNCSEGETIYVNGEHKFIDSNNENHKTTTLFNDFNYNYLDINISENDFDENIYETSIPCKIVIDYSPIRKVGV